MSSTLEGQDPVDVVQVRYAAPYTSLSSQPARSSCLVDTLNVGLLVVFPCEPMARTASSVGISYAVVFLVVTLVYGGGIACFGASTTVDHPLFDLSTRSAVLTAWVFSMAGAVPSIPVVLFGWLLASVGPYLDDEPDTKFDTSDTSMALVGVFLCAQVVWLVVVGYLREEILRRTGASSCCASCLGSCCFTLWFPCCSFAEAMQRARMSREEQQAPRTEHDELSAYIA